MRKSEHACDKFISGINSFHVATVSLVYTVWAL